MSEKDFDEKELDFELEKTEDELEPPKPLMEDEAGETEALDKDEVGYEDNDNWTFDAEAVTLNMDNMFVADDPDKDAAEILEDIDEAPEKEDKPEKNSNQIVISKEPLIFVPAVLLIIAAACVLAFFGWRYYNVPNEKEGKLMNPGSVVLTVDDVNVSAGMYNYYYSSIVSYYESYAAYGQVNLDTTQSYDTQYTTDADGNSISWADYFEQQTLQQIEYITVYYARALDEGVTLTQKQKDTIDEQLATLETSAEEDGKTLDDYIKTQFGKYVSIETLRAMLEQYYYAVNYRGLYTTKDLDEEYLESYRTEHSQEYYSIDISYLAIEYNTESDETKAASIETAKGYAARMTDADSVEELVPEVYESFIAQDAESLMSSDDTLSEEEAMEQALENYSSSTRTTVSYTDSVNYFDAATTQFLFSDGEVGTATYCASESQGYIYIILKTDEPYQDETTVYSVRHILVSPDSLPSDDADTEEETTTDADTQAAADADTQAAADADTATADATAEDGTTDDTGYTDEQMQAAFDFAEQLLNQFLNGDQSVASFAALAEEYSADSGSTTMSGQNDVYGGLYEMTEETNFVDSFKDWVLDESRQPGDTSIVESTYGYHVMYFVKSAPSYETSLVNDARATLLNKMIDEADIKVNQGRLDKTVEGYMEYKNANASTSTTTQTGSDSAN